ncbi:MAG TPA: hypothetical protein VEZ42_15970 [Pseudonocardia sp.]|nr:hypothetical protein [Pseudonocardia sp.]
MPEPTQPPDGASVFRGVAVQLAPMTDTWQRILREHRRTPSGHCAAPSCGRPGYGSQDYEVFPCGARALAEHARALHRAAGGST